MLVLLLLGCLICPVIFGETDLSLAIPFLRKGGFLHSALSTARDKVDAR